MKKQKKDHGIISIVQSPDGGENNSIKRKKTVKGKAHDKDKGIISVIQTPEEDKIIIGN